MAYDELGTLVTAVNTEVAELEAAKESVVQAEQLYVAADAARKAEEDQVESKLDELLAAVQNRIALLRGNPEPGTDPVP